MRQSTIVDPVIIRYCQDELGVDYPLATQTFKTDRRNIYMHAGDDRLLEVLGGQKGAQAWDRILDPFLENLDYQNEFARRWWPLGKEDKRVAVKLDQPITASTNACVTFPDKKIMQHRRLWTNNSATCCTSRSGRACAFGESVTGRASWVDTLASMLYRRMDYFEAEGIVDLFDTERAK